MKLTPLAKLFVAVIVIGTVGYLAYHYRGAGRPSAGSPDDRKKDESAKGDGKGDGDGKGTPKPAPRSGKRIIVGVNDFGGAYPGVVANRGAAPGEGSHFTAAGLEVEFKLIRGSKERLAAFDSGEVDVMLLTLDYLANLVPQYKAKGVDLKAFLMADWSRGNLGIVTKPGIRNIEGLKEARAATTRNTPTHYFLLSLLRRSNLSPAEIERVKSNLVFATKTPLAGEMFQRGEVDAVAIWEPHLTAATGGDKGRLLVSTVTASNFIADVLFARGDWIKAHEQDLVAFTKAWFEGVAEIEKDTGAAVERYAKAFAVPPVEAQALLAKIKPTTFADNREFFGLERERAPFLSLFDDAARFWQREGVIQSLPNAAEARYLKALEANAATHTSEKIVEKWRFAAPAKDATPLLTKSVSIYFPSGGDSIDPNARKILDTFADTLAEFGNAYVRVEGNTDSQGSRAKNIELSRRRSRAVVDYLVAQYRFDGARFQAVGNGPDKPVGDNATAGGREVNRRTDFQIIPNN